MRLLMGQGIKIEHDQSRVLKRPLVTLPVGEELLLPVCPVGEEREHAVLPEGAYVYAAQPIAKGKGSQPLAPVSGTIGEACVLCLPSRGDMLCVRFYPGEKAESPARALGRPSAKNATKQQILESAGMANVIDEIDGLPLRDKLEEFAACGVQLLACDAVCDDPYCADGLMALMEMTQEVCDGLRLAARACNGARTLLVYSGADLSLHALRRLRGQLSGEQTLSVAGKYPIWSSLARRKPFSGAPFGRVGVQACLRLGQAVRLGRAPQRCVITLAGNAVRTPGSFNVVIGTPVGEVLQQGGVKEEELHTVVLGGGIRGEAVLDLRTPVLQDTRCVLALSGKLAPRRMACIECGKCDEVCGENMFPSAALHALRQGNRAGAKEFGLVNCTGCAACEAACPAAFPVAQLLYEAACAEKGKEGAKQGR